MKRPKLIALCGEAGSGKTTVANHLRTSGRTIDVTLALPLKLLVRDVFGLESRHVFGSPEDKAELLTHVRGAGGQQRTPRQLLEHIGTEGFRTMDPDIWLKLLEREIDAGFPQLYKAHRWTAEPRAVTISDVRFRNELEMVKRRGGQVWLVERVGGGSERREHGSDREWRAFPKDRILLATSGDVATLQSEADHALDAMLRAEQ